MIYYKSKYLSERLLINLAKWKRWVREFLPPDPLGGLQSGYARQFNLKEAFRVYLGGQLVGAMRFSIPQTRKILTDLDSELEALGFYDLYPNQRRVPIENHWLCIYNMPQGGFEYGLGATPREPSKSKACFGGVLHLSEVYNAFLEGIDGIS